MYLPSTKPNTRIDVADILRGIAIGGIILIHSIEHYNFYDFPELTALDHKIWDTTFFLLGGKMYAIFAMLFGLSFFIQHDNQAQKGKDFRLRFAWRMLLLFVIGTINCTLYNGDILMIYALGGFLIIPFIRMCDKALFWIAAFLFIQPIEFIYIILALFNPNIQPLDLHSGVHYMTINPALADGTFLDACKASFQHGFLANVLWAFERGRMTQTIFLFILGMIIGRKRLFYNEDNHLKIWKKVLIGAVIAFVPLCTAFFVVPDLISNATIKCSMTVILDMWKNFSMMLIVVSGTVLLFYKTKFGKKLMVMAPYGKMSLTNYVGQSLIGGMLFYNWGFGLYRVCGHTESFLIGVCIVLLQIIFCHWWLSKHQRGPLEDLWRRATWINNK